tara:strand:- start:1568 stop:1762 length:195 start_codon:yes stop_codon:yes gene_type:complete
MDTFKKVIYEDNKQFLEMVCKDLYDENNIKAFLEKYHKKNYSYYQPSVDDVKSFHKRHIKNIKK